MNGPFGNRDFRRLFAGRVITNIGDSFYFVAAMWLVYDLTGDPFYSGLAGFVTMAPSAFQFLAGPLVDRWPVRAVLTVTQLVQAVVVLVVPVAAYFGVLSVWLVLLVMPLLSMLNQLVYPAQSAALPRLVEESELVSANSAFAVAYQGVDMVANAAGGIVLALVGGVALFAFDSVTFLAAALLFVTVVVPPAEDESPDADTADEPGDVPTEGDSAVAADGGDDVEPNADGSDAAGEERYLDRLSEGIGVMRGTFLLWLIAGAAVINFASGISLAAMPAYADGLDIGGLPAILGGAGAYGVLMGAFAAGNLLGAIGANAISDRPLGRVMVVGFLVSGVCWTAAIAAGWLPATALLLAAAFVPVGAFNVQISAAVQSAVPERLVGRVSSVLGSAATVAIPFGSLLGGLIAGAISPRAAMWGTGIAFVLLSAYALAVPALRELPVVSEITLEPNV